MLEADEFKNPVRYDDFLMVDNFFIEAQQDVLIKNNNQDGVHELFRDEDPPHKIGEGSFGIVWKRWYGGHAFAVKVVKVNAAEAGILLKEVKVLLKLHHPNIVRYFYSYTTYAFQERYCNIAMELVNEDGATLAQEVGKNHPEATLLRWLQECLEGIKYLHENNVLHRDIKPGNIMLKWTGKGENYRQSIKIVDFGLATTVEDDNLYVSTKHVVGTKLYSSFEKAIGLHYDSRDDIWGLGSVFLELTTRRKLSRCLACFEHNNTIQETKGSLLRDCGSNYPASNVPEAIKLMLLATKERPRIAEDLLQVLRSAAPVVLLSAVAAGAESESAEHTVDVAGGGDDVERTTTTHNYIQMIKSPLSWLLILASMLAAMSLRNLVRFFPPAPAPQNTTTTNNNNKEFAAASEPLNLAAAIELKDSQKDYIKAFPTFIEIATKYNSWEAMLHLGQMYRDGLGMSSNPTAAYQWFHEAAQQAPDQAKPFLDLCREERCEKDFDPLYYDFKRADKLFQAEDYQSIMPIFTHTLVYLGIMYRDGLGVEQPDPVQAFCFFLQANSYDNGYEEPNRHLSFCREGRCAKDFAEDWFQLSLKCKTDGNLDKALALLTDAVKYGHVEAKATVDAYMLERKQAEDILKQKQEYEAEQAKISQIDPTMTRRECKRGRQLRVESHSSRRYGEGCNLNEGLRKLAKSITGKDPDALKSKDFWETIIYEQECQSIFYNYLGQELSRSDWVADRQVTLNDQNKRTENMC